MDEPKINDIIVKFKNDQLNEMLDKTVNLLSIINKVIINKNKIFDTINSNVLIQLNDRLEIIENNIDMLNTELEEIIFDISNNINIDNTEYKNNINKIKEDISHTRNVIKPFLPYLLIYSINLQLSNI